VTFWTFLIGAASLSALPLVTAGFYSKDLILFTAWTSDRGSFWLWAAGLAGAFLTGLYAFRMVFLALFGKAKTAVAERPGRAIHVPLIVLAIFSLVSGFIQMPAAIAPVTVFTDFISRTLPAVKMIPLTRMEEVILFLDALVVPILGVFAAWLLYLRRPEVASALINKPTGALIHRFWFIGWGFDVLYDILFVRPFVWAARVNRGDFVDLFISGAAWSSARLAEALAGTQSGMIRRYALGIVLGVVIAIGVVLVL